MGDVRGEEGFLGNGGWLGWADAFCCWSACLVPRVRLDRELVVRPGLWPSLLRFDILISRFFTTVKFQVYLNDFDIY